MTTLGRRKTRGTTNAQNVDTSMEKLHVKRRRNKCHAHIVCLSMSQEWKAPKKEEEAPPQAAVTNHQEEPETTQKATIPAQDEAARSNVVRMAVDYLQDEFPQKCQWGALVQ